MISAKLRGLQALAPLTLDGSILRHLSQPTWQPPGELIGEHSVNNTVKFRSSLFSYASLKGKKSSAFCTNTPKLQPTVLFSNVSALSCPRSVSSKSVQTQAQEPSNLSLISDKLAVAFHKLNAWECKRLSDQPLTENGPHGKSPTVWFALAELAYSPALFNLGVWYERRAAANSCGDTTVQLRYLSKAEENYKRAFLIDAHPMAAYNLACLLLRSDRTEVQIGAQIKSISSLMEVAADSGIEAARNFLHK